MKVDQLALGRIRPSLRNPAGELRRIAEILRREFTRLYRKLNMILHGGHLHSTNLQAIAETLTPLIGAGVDQIVHVGLKFQIPPIALSATAQVRLDYMNRATIGSPGNLLDILEIS